MQKLFAWQSKNLGSIFRTSSRQYAMEGVMNKYHLFKMNSRGGRYYPEEIATGLRKSLRTVVEM
jgi:hypothetical protein